MLKEQQKDDVESESGVSRDYLSTTAREQAQKVEVADGTTKIGSEGERKHHL